MKVTKKKGVIIVLRVMSDTCWMDKALMKGPGIILIHMRHLQHQPIWRYFT